MKTSTKLGVIALVAVMLFASCGNMSTNTSSPYYIAGGSVGNALKSLYSQYKTTGKIDVSNTSTLMSALAIVSSYSTVKDNLKNKEFYKDFTAGMIFGSNQLVNNNNADNVVSMLGLLNGVLGNTNATTTTTTTSNNNSNNNKNNSNPPTLTNEEQKSTNDALTSLLGSLGAKR